MSTLLFLNSILQNIDELCIFIFYTFNTNGGDGDGEWLLSELDSSGDCDTSK